MQITIYHNRRCSRSRATLALLRERGMAPRFIEYLKDPPDATALRGLLKMLHMKPRELLRTGEPAFRKLRLDRPGLSEAEIVAAIVAHPVLMERPVVVAGRRAAIGRPLERVLELL